VEGADAATCAEVGVEGVDAATCAEVGVEGVDVELADQDVGAAGGVGSAREEGKVEDADDEVAAAMLEDGVLPGVEGRMRRDWGWCSSLQAPPPSSVATHSSSSRGR